MRARSIRTIDMDTDRRADMDTNAREASMVGSPWNAGLAAALGLLALLPVQAANGAAPAVEPVALVTELAGSGSVAQKPDGGALEQLHELLPGAVVTLSAGARAVVVHTASGTVYDLGGPGRYQVQPQALEALSGRLARRELPPEIRGFRLKPLSTMQASIVMRGSAPARLEGPQGGVLGADELTYRLRGDLVAPSLELLDAEGNRIAGAREAPASFNPAQATALQPGKPYVVRVKGSDSRGKPVELSSRFWLIEGDAAARLQAARPAASASTTDLIVYSMALESAGATATAREAWRMVNERR
jgi:hypothetical protein